MDNCRRCQFSDQLKIDSASSEEHRVKISQILFHNRMNGCYKWPQIPHTRHTSRTFCGHKPDMSWVFSESCPVSKFVSRILGVFMFATLILLASAAPLTTETIVISGARSQPLGMACQRHFGHKVQSCILPFQSRVQMPEVDDDQLKDIMGADKHICIEYQLVLLCLHSALTECPTLLNLKRVQTTLDSQWVGRVNHLCSIPTETSKPLTTSGNDDLANYIHKQNSPEDVNQLSEGIVHTLTTTKLENDISASKSTDSHSTSLATSSRQLSPLQREESVLLDHSTYGESHDMQLNIYNFVNNYQYDKSRVQQDKEYSRPSFLRVMFEKSSGRVIHVNLLLLMTVCIIVTINIH